VVHGESEGVFDARAFVGIEAAHDEASAGASLIDHAVTVPNCSWIPFDGTAGSVTKKRWF
jgi:hypothetical protein